MHNPNLQAQTPGRGDLGALLALTLLAIALLLGYQHFSEPSPTTAPLQSEMQQSSGKPEPGKSSLPQLANGGPVARPAATTIEKGAISGSLKSQGQFGWLTFVAGPLYLALRFLYEHGIGNWGWAIIVFTLIFNCLMFWPRIVSIRSSLKMMRVQPKVEALKNRFAHLKFNDPERAGMNKEMVALYKAEGANMYGGCLPILLQMPLFFAYMRVLQNAVELHNAHWFWLVDLSLPDPLHILPILIIGSMFLTQYITPTPGMDPTQRRMLAILMPVIMGFTLWHYASGLALYWATCNLCNLLLQLLINRSDIGKEMHALAARRA